MSVGHVVVRVHSLYEDTVEVFDGMPRAVRAQLLLRFVFLRRRGPASPDLRVVVDDLDSVQAFTAELSLGD